MFGAATKKTYLPRLSLILGTESCCEVHYLNWHDIIMLNKIQTFYSIIFIEYSVAPITDYSIFHMHIAKSSIALAGGMLYHIVASHK